LKQVVNGKNRTEIGIRAENLMVKMNTTNIASCHSEFAATETPDRGSRTLDVRRRLKAVMVREVDQEILLLDIESNLIHKLNQTASFIWQRLDEVCSADELARGLAKEFEVEEHVAQGDVLEMLGKLIELKLVVAA
jgi:Coenzyme PQQ synthesis protein D (PqqD)